MDVILLTSVLERNSEREVKNSIRSIGSYQIAWHLRQNNYSVQVIDFLNFFTYDEIMQALERYITEDTKIIGLGLLGHRYISPLFYLKIELVLVNVRKKYPWIKIIGGGPTAINFPFEFPKGIFDYIFLGNSEDTVLAFCNNIFKNGPPVKWELGVNDVKLIKENSSPQVENKFNIENCRHSWDHRDFIQPEEPLPLETTRGCIFKCKFCSYPHIGKHRKDFLRSMDCIREELIDNYNKYKTTIYYILDDTFNADVERVKEFAGMVKTLPFKIKYNVFLRLDLIEAHPETEDILLESGLYSCFFGIESFHPVSSKLVGKAFSGKKAKAYLPYLVNEKWKEKIIVTIGLIAGLPPESLEDLFETNNWLVKNKINSWSWNPLYINFRSPDHVFKSEFEINYEKYGFKKHETENYWRSEHCDYPKSIQWAKNLQMAVYSHIKMPGFYVLDLIKIGYTEEDIRKNTMQDWQFLNSEISKKSKDWVNIYKNQIMTQ